MKKLVFLFVFLASTFTGMSQLNAEQKKIRQVFFDFLKFYKKNERKFYSFDLVKESGKEQGPPYKINWKEAERYFAYLRKSVIYVGEAYITAERKHFQFYDSCYKADPQEEIIVGFDFDRWGGGQEASEYLIKYHTDPKNKYEIKITGDKALLRIGSPLWEGAEEKDCAWSEVPFVKEKGKWVMADNIYPAD